MKQYPRIYSVSTVGLIFHYNVDYKLNSFRTDFTGESGIGKSMIADLLQLIFVAKAGFYKPGTDSSGSQGRDIATLPLESIGYAFVNIQKSEHQFLTIGVYIQKSIGNVRPFIIQKGIHWDRNSEFEYNDKILLHRSFLGENNKIPDIETLKKEILKPKGCILESFNDVSTYHHLLFYNEILPIDLSQEDNKLQTYSQIIQSFARAKTTMLKRNEFKNFLFADDDDIYDEYRKQIISLESFHRQYQDQRDTISRVKVRFDVLKVYKDVFVAVKKAKVLYLTATTVFNHQQVQAIEQEYKIARNNFVENSLRFLYLNLQIAHHEFESEHKRESQLAGRLKENEAEQRQTESDLAKCREKQVDAKDQIQTLQRVYDEYIPINKGMKDLDLLLKIYQTTKVIQNEIERQPLAKRNKQILSEYIFTLTEAQLLEAFAASDYSKLSFDESYQKNLNEVRQIKEEIEQIEKLLSAYSKDNVNSITHWVFNQPERSFSLEEESILRHFIHLSTVQPKEETEQRYIPSPDQLLTQSKISIRNSDSFWIDMGGVYERVKLIKNTIWDSTEHRTNNIGVFVEEIKNNLRVKQTNLQKKEKLLLVLHQAGWSRELLALYINREQVLHFTEDTSLPTLSQFEDMKLWNARKDFHVNLFKNTESELQKARDNERELDRLVTEHTTKHKLQSSVIDELTTKISEAQQKQSSKQIEVKGWNEKLSGINNDYFETIKEELIKNIIEEMGVILKVYIKEGEVQISKIYEEKITPLLKSNSVIESRMKELDDPSFINGIEMLKQKHIESLNNYSVKLGYDINLTENYPIYSHESVKQATDTHTNLELQLDEIHRNKIQPLLPDNESIGLTKDLDIIATELIPKVFEGKKVNNVAENLEEEVMNYLNSINEKMKTIDEHKVGIIQNIFGKVSDVYYDFEDKIKDIKSFFDEKEITGEIKIRLDFTPSEHYPIEWINTLKKKINNANVDSTPLFKNNSKEENSAEEIIINVFKQFSTSRVKDPDIKKLTNPKSYFDVEVNLVRKSGEKIDGSSGQDYAKIALLCIARLSRIERDKKGKNRALIPGIRFMPIDEVAGLGGNFTLLNEIAEEYDYQILTMTIAPGIGFDEGKQYIYMLNTNKESTQLKINTPPFGLFSGSDLQKDISHYIKAQADEKGINLPGN